MSFDQHSVRDLGTAIEEDLREMLNGMGLVPIVGHARFSDNNVTFKLEIARRIGGIVMTKEAKNFIRMANAGRLGSLKASDLNKRFKDPMNKLYTIIGANPKARVRPVLAIDDRGRKFVLPAQCVDPI